MKVKKQQSDTKNLIVGAVMIVMFSLAMGLIAWFITGGMYTRAVLTMLVWVIGQVAFLMATDSDF